MGPLLCTTATQMSLFEHVSKHSLRFYHMSLVRTPPCSTLLYSVYTDAFQSDCLASFSLCMSRSLIRFLAFTSTSLRCLHFIHLPFFFSLIYVFPSNFDITLTPPSARLVCDVIFAVSALLYEYEKKNMLRGEGVCQNKTSNPLKLCCY